MRAQLVKGPGSKLHGVPCGLCSRKVSAGEAVLYHHMANDAYAEDRLVYHVSCMSRLCASAPAGQAEAAAADELDALTASLVATGNLFAA